MNPSRRRWSRHGNVKGTRRSRWSDGRHGPPNSRACECECERGMGRSRGWAWACESVPRDALQRPIWAQLAFRGTSDSRYSGRFSGHAQPVPFRASICWLWQLLHGYLICPPPPVSLLDDPLRPCPVPRTAVQPAALLQSNPLATPGTNPCPASPSPPRPAPRPT